MTEQPDASAVRERDLGPIAVLIGDPTRAAMLAALAEGHALPFARSCLDWTERRPHLTGALPAAITARLVELGWLTAGTGRGLRVAADFDQRLNSWLPRQ